MEKVALLVIGVALVGVAVVKRCQEKGLDEIRGDVYQLFLMAEHRFQSGEGKAKMDYVITMAKELIPSPFNMFITEALLRKAVQAWFDLIKDLLDDGKLNGTKGVDCNENQ
jgi:hypothetical protein